MREINVSRAGDPVHAGDKAFTREIPAKRGRVNRYEIICKFHVQKVNILKELFYTLAQTYGILSHPTLKV
jgi:hypothetical protein